MTFGITDLSAGNRPMVERLCKLYEAWAEQVDVEHWSRLLPDVERLYGKALGLGSEC